MNRWALAFGITFFLSCWAPKAGAQVIQGRVLEVGGVEGIDGVTVTLVDSEGQALLRAQTDEFGQFKIPVGEPGRYQIVGERIGFATARSGWFEVEREILEVQLRMAQEPIALDPLTVVGRRKIQSGTLDEYYQRMEENRPLGIGHFITAEEIEKRPVFNSSELLRTVPDMEIIPQGGIGNEVWMWVAGKRCVPNFYLDGLPMHLPDNTGLDQIVKTQDLEGIEIYNRGHLDRAFGYEVEPCGAVLLWRKKNWGHPFSLSRALLAVGLGLVLVAVGGGF